MSNIHQINTDRLTYAGSPNNIVIPNFIGQTCVDTSNKKVYTSTSLNKSDWKISSVPFETGSYYITLTEQGNSITLNAKSNSIAGAPHLYLRGGTLDEGIFIEGRNMRPDLDGAGYLGTADRLWLSVNARYMNAANGINVSSMNEDSGYQIDSKKVVSLYKGWDNSLYLNSSYDPSTGGSKPSFGAIKFTGHFLPASGNWDLGATYARLGTVFSTNNINVSDRKFKDNILPLNNNAFIKENLPIHLSLENKYYNFIKDMPMYEYDYKLLNNDGTYRTGDESHCLGFIAQDIYETEIGKKFVFESEDENGEKYLSYNQNGYIGSLTLALQEAINKIESLELRLSKVEK